MPGGTIDDCDREIARLMGLVAALKRQRKAMVKRAEMAANKQKPAFVARWRHGMALAAADPVRKALRSANASRGQKNSARGLPPMTRRQHLDYLKLRRHAGFTRDEALAEIFRNSGAPSPPIPPSAAMPTAAATASAPASLEPLTRVGPGRE